MATDYADLVFGKALGTVDPAVSRIVELEEERQVRKLILIPSESICPRPVREALGSVFTNLYAEGYPPLAMTRQPEERILDFADQLTTYRRYADRRFYKGCDYAHFVETLAQRRVARCFATDAAGEDDIFVNVQPLSGAAANNAVYEAFVEPGGTVMGMSLAHGGHLTHGSEFNRSGKRYNIVSYDVNRETELLDYDAIMELALTHKPQMIIAGYTSYPWAPDWAKFREIADAAGAILLADIAHPAGMVIAGEYPTPVGYADVVTFTTHKTLCGPRAAVILTTDEENARRVDSAVFPGEQGGPHVNKFAAMAVAFKIAQTDAFKDLQRRIVENARHLAAALQRAGLRLAYGGTNTHLLVIDLNAVPSDTGFPLKGEIAARLLDQCGLVVNKNTIPGDASAADASGIRLGTPWVTQRGMGPSEMEEIAGHIHRVVTHIRPFTFVGLRGDLPRGKIPLDILEEVRREVDGLASRAKGEEPPRRSGYPHYAILAADKARGTSRLSHPVKTDGPVCLQDLRRVPVLMDLSDVGVLEVRGERALAFLEGACTQRMLNLSPGESRRSFLLDERGAVLDDVVVVRLDQDEVGRSRCLMLTNPPNTERAKAWLRGLADGYTVFDEEDLFAKIEGPVTIQDLSSEPPPCMEPRVALGLFGEGAAEALGQLAQAFPRSNPAPLLWQGEMAGQHVLTFRATPFDGDAAFMLICGQGEAEALWRAISEDQGQALRVVDVATRRELRKEAGLPAYTQGQPRPSAEALYRASKASLFDLTKTYFVGQRSLPATPAPAAEFHFKPQDKPPKRTPLHEVHTTLAKKMITFAGWEMPTWYTSTSEEHRAVRETAALFDVSHMGVLEVAGEQATAFLDAVTTNYVRGMRSGQSIYSYLLDPEGEVLDDIMIYHRAADRYMIVVNAVNEEEDLAWLRAVQGRKVVIDRECPGKVAPDSAVIRSLKDAAAGDEQRVDLALQGPNSLAILQQLAEDSAVQQRLARLKRTELIETTLAGIPLVASRTGYTGEDAGYELLAHPDNLPTLWAILMERGAPLGIKPAGLGARDSTRIEAGLPLYGHELAGELHISPREAGFGSYVKLHKPFFIGRRPYIEKNADPKMAVVRFRLRAKGVRMTRPGDAVVARKTQQIIGTVTSCAVDLEGYQLGLAYVDRRFQHEGTPIAVLSSRSKAEAGQEAAPDGVGVGERISLPEEAVVLSRFLRHRE